MTELQGHEDRVEIGADSGVFVRSRTEGLHGRSRVGGSALSLCQRAECYQSRPWDLQGYADDVLAICRELDLWDVIFVGHSVSAMIGVLAAIDEPARFSKLVLIGPSACYINDGDYLGGFSRED